jgi:hypothetical protein
VPSRTPAGPPRRTFGFLPARQHLCAGGSQPPPERRCWNPRDPRVFGSNRRIRRRSPASVPCRSRIPRLAVVVVVVVVVVVIIRDASILSPAYEVEAGREREREALAELLKERRSSAARQLRDACFVFCFLRTRNPLVHLVVPNIPRPQCWCEAVPAAPAAADKGPQRTNGARSGPASVHRDRQRGGRGRSTGRSTKILVSSIRVQILGNCTEMRKQ